jgi:hypothetical protein
MVEPTIVQIILAFLRHMSILQKQSAWRKTSQLRSQEPESRIQEKTNQDSLHLNCRLFEPQNIEQGISNIEVITSSFCDSSSAVRPARHHARHVSKARRAGRPPEADSGEAAGIQ